MATLVLTAVGSAIGGPIGGAIGGVVGQVFDRTVLFRPKGRQGPRLTELALHTSSYGTQIPKIYGTMRVAGCVIWSTDLIEARGSSGSGKGQPTTTTYSYSASFAVALSGRPIVGVGRIWAEGKLLRGAGGDWKAMTGFRLHTGGEGQMPDPLIASAEGIALAPAHRGIAYAVFENLQLADYGNRIPSLTFEVIADAAPVAIGRIAAEIGGGAIVGAGPGATLDGFSSAGDSARGVLETLAEAAGAWFVPTGDGLAMRDEPEAPIPVADDGSGGLRRARTVQPLETVPRTIALAHYDPLRDWQIGVQQARRPGAGVRAERIELPAALSATAAKAMAETRLARAEGARVRRRVTTDASAMAIPPGAAVTIAGESGVWRVVSATLERMAVTLELTPVVPAVLSMAATGGRVLGAPDVVAGTTIVHAFETPALDETLPGAPRLTIVAAGSAPGWRRAALLYSLDDGISWIAAGTTASPATIGSVAVGSGAGSAILVDRRSAVEVVLAHYAMALESVSVAAIDRGANLALIGGELVQFESAVQIDATRWRLSGLHRARRGTIGAAHGAGARFVLIEDGAAVALNLATAAPGMPVRVMASGVGDAAGPVEATVSLTGAAMVPPSPVHLAAVSLAGGGARLSWVRRSRSGWRWRDGSDAPLGEEAEAYRVTILSASSVSRTQTVTEPWIEATPGERAAGPITLTVQQIGSNGLSAPATRTL